MDTGYASEQNFNRNEPNYKCCCGCMHVTTGTMVLAVLGAIGVGLQVIQLVVAFTGNNVQGGVVGMEVANLLIGGAVVICLFIGLRSKRAQYLIPYLVVQVLGMLGCAILFVIAIIAFASNASFARDFLKTVAGSSNVNTINSNNNAPVDVAKISAGAMIFGSIIGMLFQVWFFWVVLKCYTFFRNQANYIGLSHGFKAPEAEKY